MKSILFKIWKFPQLSETFIVNQVVLAIEQGYDVRLLVEDIYDFETNLNTEFCDKYDLNKKIIPEDYGIPTSKIKRILAAGFIILKNPGLWKFFLRCAKIDRKFSSKRIFQIQFYRKLKAFNVFHIQYGTNKAPVDLFKEIGLVKAKLVVTFHGHDLHFPINNWLSDQNYYKLVFKTSHSLVCNTTYLKNKLLKIGAPQNKVHTIPVAVDTEYFKPKKYSKNITEKVQLITVGRIDELKGQIYGIKAMELLLKNGLDIKYTIVGTGPELEKLREYVSLAGLDDHIVFTGALTQEFIKEYLQKSHIFLMTSITDSKGMAESQGLVTAEAQATGLPVIAFNSGGIKYTVLDGESGFLCEEKDVEVFAAKAKLLIVDSALRERMAIKARSFIVEEFSNISVRKKWRCIYG